MRSQQGQVLIGLSFMFSSCQNCIKKTGPAKKGSDSKENPRGFSPKYQGEADKGDDRENEKIGLHLVLDFQICDFIVRPEFRHDWHAVGLKRFAIFKTIIPAI